MLEEFSKEEYFVNRELSWLEFNDRVFEEAIDRDNPLLERLKFMAIVSSNLDEFFMVRVASLKDQVNANYNKKDPAGLSPKKQLKEIAIRSRKLVKEQYNHYKNVLLDEIKDNGLDIISINDLSNEDELFLRKYFSNYVYPVLTPMAVDSSRPFPLILNKSLNIAVLLEDENNDIIFSTVQVPSILPRLIELPKTDKCKRFIFMEDIIILFLQKLFSGKKILSAHCYRITRNGDLSIHEEGAEDLLMEIEKSLKERKRGEAIRLEVDNDIDERIVNILKAVLDIHRGEIYYIDGPIDMTFLFKEIKKIENKDLMYPEYSGRIVEEFSTKESMFEVIRDKDVFLHHPYDSFEPVVKFIEDASKDPKVLAIKQTLYRVSGDSPIVKSLEQAADRGKQVTVLVELKARFDEENNINWAKQLEKAGCHVIYGLVGLKTHSKITLVVRKEEGRIRRYVHLGTGNYNDITAKLYTDMGLFTSNEAFGVDASGIFNILTGYSDPPNLYKLDMAPLTLRQKFIELIENETRISQSGGKGKIIAKMNSLVDPEIIKYLYKASSKGVEIDLIVRGICCLRPGIKGISENITVTSIVGRFLEHSRAYYFYNDSKENVYLSSADWMPRNLNRRVELLFPIEDRDIKNKIISILKVQLNDTEKARIMDIDGKYYRPMNEKKFTLNSQEFFMNNTNKSVVLKTMSSFES